MASQITGTYGKMGEEYTASQIAAVNVAKRAYQKEYMEYCMEALSFLALSNDPKDSIFSRHV